MYGNVKDFSRETILPDVRQLTANGKDISKRSPVDYEAGGGFYNKRLNVYERSFFNDDNTHVDVRILLV